MLRYLWASPNTAIGLLLALPVFAAGGRGRIVGGVLEVHGPLARAVLRRCVPVLGGATAITFGHIVVGQDAGCLEASRAHERVHVRQCEFWGPVFLPAHLLAALWGWLQGRGAYRGNWFEREAVRRTDTDPGPIPQEGGPERARRPDEGNMLRSGR